MKNKVNLMSTLAQTICIFKYHFITANRYSWNPRKNKSNFHVSPYYLNLNIRTSVQIRLNNIEKTLMNL